MIGNILIGLVAAIHIAILVLEMALWTRPARRKAFGLTPNFAEQTRVLAANQGLYNGFLATGLIYGLLLGPEGFAFKMFFALCVLAAGIFGGLTSSRKILFVQAVPAALAIAALLAKI